MAAIRKLCPCIINGIENFLIEPLTALDKGIEFNKKWKTGSS